MLERLNRLGWDKLSGVGLVLLLHGTLLYGAWSYRLIPAPDAAVTLFVDLINPPLPPKKEEPPRPPLPRQVKLVKPHPVELPRPEPLLVTSASAVSAVEPAVVPQPTEPVVDTASTPETVVAVPSKPPAPVTLTAELAVSCPLRTPPEYPSISRRLNEQGLVVLQVELDENGHVTSAHVVQSAGFKRLDEAGLAAVRQWRCNVPTRNGEAVRAVAMQPFTFVLEGRR